ncbi:mitochondrial import inner membrane translocase subunit tim54 [Dimargaris verticillata]|uniref:Mitochondrial import inner membrane translocase subunit TIM54 n=1 Tax=Dimargaris verticillata TaxID=2761393 RepID=A0A9W8B7T4_9FUNG|nr:mitochondrial import inner membrane translocase subunit tim54 [Dimargaris verticillata]
MAGFKLPSPKTTAVVSVLGGLVGLKKYDNYKCDQIRDAFKREAQVKAQEPLGPFDMPSKVVVYLTPPPGDGIHKSRIFFREYVKPIFDAAALDYDVVEGSEAGDVHSRVAEELKQRRREVIQSENELPSLSSPSVPALPSQQPPNLAKQQNPALFPKIAIGRNTWVEVLNGLSEGATESLKVAPEPTPELITDATDAVVAPTTASEADNMTEPPATTTPVVESDTPAIFESAASPSPSTPSADTTALAPPPIDYDSMDRGVIPPLPTLGFINFQNRVGWTSIPRRIFGFFHDAPQVQTIGAQALCIALERQRPWNAATDGDLGTEDNTVHQLSPDDVMPLVMESRVLSLLSTYERPTPNDKEAATFD